MLTSATPQPNCPFLSINKVLYPYIARYLDPKSTDMLRLSCRQIYISLPRTIPINDTNFEAFLNEDALFKNKKSRFKYESAFKGK